MAKEDILQEKMFLNELEKNEQVLYRYCNAEGLFNVDYSPNGSINNIAGICNKERNVFAMMPHPERACSSLIRQYRWKKGIFRFIFYKLTLKK